MNEAIQVDPDPLEAVAIQGELGSNSHLAVLQALGSAASVRPCSSSAEVFDALEQQPGLQAVLPIENSLHGSVAEHYDLLLERDVVIAGEISVRVRHNVIACPGVSITDVKRILSHPVALSQCRRWLRAHPRVEASPFYDTAGSVKHILQHGVRDTAAIAPLLAAEVYGAEVIEPGVEDHEENYTRFFRLKSAPPPPRRGIPEESAGEPNKMSLAFRVEHRPGTLLAGLAVFERAGLNLTHIESRPVPGRPWEYVFFVDLRFVTGDQLDASVAELRTISSMVRELGRYRAAE